MTSSNRKERKRRTTKLWKRRKTFLRNADKLHQDCDIEVYVMLYHRETNQIWQYSDGFCPPPQEKLVRYSLVVSYALLLTEVANDVSPATLFRPSKERRYWSIEHGSSIGSGVGGSNAGGVGGLNPSGVEDVLKASVENSIGMFSRAFWLTLVEITKRLRDLPTMLATSCLNLWISSTADTRISFYHIVSSSN